MYELLGGVVMNSIPSNNEITHEFNENLLQLLTLLLEEYLRIEKLNTAPPK